MSSSGLHALLLLGSVLVLLYFTCKSTRSGICGSASVVRVEAAPQPYLIYSSMSASSGELLGGAGTTTYHNVVLPRMSPTISHRSGGQRFGR